MLILDKLWNGELDPSGRRINGLSQSRREMDQAEEQLMEVLPPEGRKCFEAYDNAWVTQAAALEKDAFFTGFRMAGLLLLDIIRGADAQ